MKLCNREFDCYGNNIIVRLFGWDWNDRRGAELYFDNYWGFGKKYRCQLKEGHQGRHVFKNIKIRANADLYWG